MLDSTRAGAYREDPLFVDCRLVVGNTSGVQHQSAAHSPCLKGIPVLPVEAGQPRGLVAALEYH